MKFINLFQNTQFQMIDFHILNRKKLLEHVLLHLLVWLIIVIIEPQDHRRVVIILQIILESALLLQWTENVDPLDGNVNVVVM